MKHKNKQNFTSLNEHKISFEKWCGIILLSSTLGGCGAGGNSNQATGGKATQQQILTNSNNTKPTLSEGGVNKTTVRSYIHLNMNNKMQQNLSANNTDNLDLGSVSADILQKNEIYLLDFSQIKSSTEMANAKHDFYKSSVASFDNDLVFCQSS